MAVNQFLKDPRVTEAVARVQILKEHQRQYSDILDSEGNQYVDFVMEGGGVLGVALTGYTYVLEQAGIRFLGIGGTSAGAINALMLAALGTPDQAKSVRLTEILAAMPMASFLDGDQDARDFSQALVEQAKMGKLLWKAAQVMDNFKEDLGLNPGEAFTNWLKDQLKKLHIQTLADLKKNMIMPAQLRVRSGEQPLRPLGQEDAVECMLAVIAADITTETKVEFPKMAELYWKQPDKVNPAYFVRASMSVPLFFHPFRVHDCPQNPEAWKRLANYTGKLPRQVLFIDGGIMSNFPIDVFHKPDRVPLAPTFGAKIGFERHEPARIEKPSELILAMFDAARHTLDNEFICSNPDYVHLVKSIDTGTHNWLHFELNDKDKADLFARGARAAAEFLSGFDWQGYKEIRKDMARVMQKPLQQPAKQAEPVPM